MTITCHIVTPVYAPFFDKGGPAKSVPNIVKYTRELGFHTIVHTVEHGTVNRSLNDVNYYKSTAIDRLFNLFTRSKNSFLLLTLGAIKKIGSNDTLILNCGFFLPNLILGLYAVYFLKNDKVFFIPRGSGNPKRLDFNFALKRVFLFLENLYLRKVTLIALSDKENISCYKYKRSVIIPNAIKISELKSGERNIDMIFLGRPTHEKGIEIFLKITRDYPEKSFCLIATSQNQYTKKISELINVKTFINPSQQTIKSILEQSKLFFLQSLGEGLSMALLEAAERGVIPVCNKAALPEIFYNIDGLGSFDDEDSVRSGLEKLTKTDLSRVSTQVRDCIQANYSHGNVKELWALELR